MQPVRFGVSVKVHFLEEFDKTLAGESLANHSGALDMLRVALRAKDIVYDHLPLETQHTFLVTLSLQACRGL